MKERQADNYSNFAACDIRDFAIADSTTFSRYVQTKYVLNDVTDKLFLDTACS